LELILDKSLYSFTRFFSTNIPFQIAVILETKILGKNRSRLFTVGGKENLLKSTSAVLIIIKFFLMAVS
jgi:hypothetical protein